MSGPKIVSGETGIILAEFIVWWRGHTDQKMDQKKQAN